MTATTFEREYGCTEADWLRWLPGAVGDQSLELHASHRAQVTLDAGVLQLRWTVLPPRQIALIRMPRMNVHFAFIDVADEARADFMRYFDLYMQRGGG